MTYNESKLEKLEKMVKENKFFGKKSDLMAEIHYLKVKIQLEKEEENKDEL